MSIPQDLREMAQTFRDMTQTIRVHIKQILECHEHDRDEGDPARETMSALGQKRTFAEVCAQLNSARRLESKLP
jgi:hypothetical protein